MLNVMKAKRVELQILKLWTKQQWKQIIVEEKVDGFRYSRKNGQWLSKQGKLLFNVKEIQRVLNGIPKIRKFMIDGELAGKTWEQTMTIFRSSKADVSEQLKDGKYRIFDLVDPNNLDEPFIDRKDRLIEALWNVDHPMIEVVRHQRVETFKQFLKLNGQHLDLGCDGSILKFTDGGYEFKRSKLWLKYKPQQELDCKIVGFQEGKGKYTGVLGSLIVKVPILDGTAWSSHTTKVSGMDDNDRVQMWKNQKQLLGTIVEVQFRKISRKGKMIEAHVHRPRPDKEM